MGAAKRIQREVAALLQNPKPYFVNTDSIFEWQVEMPGPPGSPYAGGLFHFVVYFPGDYPFSGPKITLQTPMFHCNVGQPSRNNEIVCPLNIKMPQVQSAPPVARASPPQTGADDAAADKSSDSARFPVTVVTLTGKTTTLEVCEETTVASLKQMLSSNHGTPQTQHIFFNSKLLDVDRTVADCGITPHARLTLVLHLRCLGVFPKRSNWSPALSVEAYLDLLYATLTRPYVELDGWCCCGDPRRYELAKTDPATYNILATMWTARHAHGDASFTSESSACDVATETPAAWVDSGWTHGGCLLLQGGLSNCTAISALLHEVSWRLFSSALIMPS